MFRTSLLIPLIFAFTFGSCAGVRSGEPAIRELYRDAAKREARNPVVVIHGILGSRLVERSTGKIVWGAFTNEAIDVETPEGARAIAVPLPGDGGAMAYDQATAAVYPSGPVGAIDVSLFFGIVSVDVYAQILRSLGVGGYADQVYAGPEYSEDHFTCHTFFYDWRRDNVENAIALGRFLKRTRAKIDRTARARVEELRERGDARSVDRADELEEWLEQGYRFDLVAHSMGGLIARYFLRYGIADLPPDGAEPEVTWAGAEEVDRVIMIGTPNLGAMDALRQLLTGFDLGWFLPRYDAAILGTMPSIYQLLPRNESRVLRDVDGSPLDVDIFDPHVWDDNGWGLLDPARAEYLSWFLTDVEDPAERRRRAKDYLTWCLDRARAFHRALDKDAETPCPREIRLFASDTLATLTTGSITRDATGRMSVRFDLPGSSSPGDATVPRFSAVADRRFGRDVAAQWLDSPIPWSSVTFLPDDHVGLTSNPHFTDNLLFFLLEQPPRSGPEARRRE